MKNANQILSENAVKELEIKELESIKNIIIEDGLRPSFSLETESGTIYFHKVEGGYIEDPEHGDTVFRARVKMNYVNTTQSKKINK